MDDRPEWVRTDITVDDCWKRIGVYGDKSCPRLAEHVHCRNCEVHALAAIRLLERYACQQEDEAPAEPAAVCESCSLLVFRLADQWLALATGSLIEVTAQMPVHSLPHQRSRSVLGVTNVRGALVACLSLAEVLGVAAGHVPATSPGPRVTPRMLILAGHCGPLVVPVDEVDGIHPVPLQLIQPAARDAGLAVSQFASGVLQWRGRSVTQLDDELLRQAMSRSFL